MTANRNILRILSLAGISAALLTPTAASAQAATSRLTIGVNGAYRAGTSDVSSTVVFTANAEAGSFTWKQPVKPGAVIDGSAHVRLWRKLGLGVGYSSFAANGSADVTARVPHPFFFNQARSIAGQTSLDHKETAVHIRAVLTSAPDRKLQVAAFVGPVFFSVTQGLVDSVAYADSYPYDTATFTSAATKRVSRSKTGVGGGVDLAYYFSKNFGVGAVASIAQATISAKAADDSSVSIKVGGTTAGLGVRIRF